MNCKIANKPENPEKGWKNLDHRVRDPIDRLSCKESSAGDREREEIGQLPLVRMFDEVSTHVGSRVEYGDYHQAYRVEEQVVRDRCRYQL